MTTLLPNVQIIQEKQITEWMWEVVSECVCCMHTTFGSKFIQYLRYYGYNRTKTSIYDVEMRSSSDMRTIQDWFFFISSCLTVNW